MPTWSQKEKRYTEETIELEESSLTTKKRDEYFRTELLNQFECLINAINGLVKE